MENPLRPPSYGPAEDSAQPAGSQGMSALPEGCPAAWNQPQISPKGLTALDSGYVLITRWRLEEELQAPLADQAAKLLNAEEHDRADRFVKPALAARFISARAGLRLRLGVCLDLDPAALTFTYGHKGKPAVDAPSKSVPPLEFNLAHSGDTALLAISRQPVGVDLEQLRPIRSADGMAQRWFTPSECRRLDQLGPGSEAHLAEFYRTWAMKEAVLKLVGTGVGESLPKLETPATQQGGNVDQLPENSLGLKRCEVRILSLGTKHAAALATESPYAPITWY